MLNIETIEKISRISKSYRKNFNGIEMSDLFDSLSVNILTNPNLLPYVAKNKKFRLYGFKLFIKCFIRLIKQIKLTSYKHPPHYTHNYWFAEEFKNNTNHTTEVFKKLSNSCYITSNNSIVNDIKEKGQDIINIEKHYRIKLLELFLLIIWLLRFIRIVNNGVKKEIAHLNYFNHFLFYELFNSYLNWATVLRIIDIKKCKGVVITGEHHPFVRLFTRVMFKARIPIYQIQHGIFRHHEKNTKIETYSKVIFVWDERMRMINPDINSNMIAVGNVAIESYIKEKKNLTKEKKALIISTPPSGIVLDEKRYNKILTTYIETALKMPDWTFYYKLHPSESFDIKIFKSSIYPFNFNFTNENIYNLIITSSVIIGVSSSTCVEIEYFNKPLILIDINQKNILPNYDSVQKVLPGESDSLVKEISDAYYTYLSKATNFKDIENKLPSDLISNYIKHDTSN